jgi:hypothetical protein
VIGVGVPELPETVVRRGPELDAGVVLGEREREESPEEELIVRRKTAGGGYRDVGEAALA